MYDSCAYVNYRERIATCNLGWAIMNAIQRKCQNWISEEIFCCLDLVNASFLTATTATRLQWISVDLRLCMANVATLVCPISWWFSFSAIFSCKPKSNTSAKSLLISLCVLIIFSKCKQIKKLMWCSLFAHTSTKENLRRETANLYFFKEWLFLNWFLIHRFVFQVMD